MAFTRAPQKPGTLQSIATGLQAFGAGVQGQGPQFQAVQQAQQQQLSNERLQSSAEDVRRAKLLFEQGDIQGIQDLAALRVQAIQSVNGDPSDSQGILNLAQGALSGDENAFRQLGNELNLAEQAAIEGGFIGGQQEQGRTFAPIDIVDPESGDVVSVIPTVVGGKVVNLPVGARPKATPEDLAKLKVSTSGDIEEKKTTELGKRDFKKQQTLLTAKQIDKGFEAITNIRSNISTIDDAIDAIDDGATTGKIANFFPSIRKSTLAFENAASRLGLDVVGSVTFGALSEGELKLAMQTAIPADMAPADLRVFLQDKKAAQEKLSQYMRKQIRFLNQGNTVVDWLDSQDPQSAETDTSAAEERLRAKGLL